MRPVSRISLKSAVPPPFYSGEPANSSADYSIARGYQVYEDGDMYYVTKAPQDGKPVEENGVIGVPRSHVVRVEYVSYVDSPLCQPKGHDPSVDGEQKRGPGRPRKEYAPLA